MQTSLGGRLWGDGCRGEREAPGTSTTQQSQHPASEGPALPMALWMPSSRERQHTGSSLPGDRPGNRRCSQKLPKSLVEGIFHVKEPQAEALVTSKMPSPLQETGNSLFMTDRNPTQHGENRTKTFLLLTPIWANTKSNGLKPSSLHYLRIQQAFLNKHPLL